MNKFQGTESVVRKIHKGAKFFVNMVSTYHFKYQLAVCTLHKNSHILL